jgi:hypothetical protein
MLGLGSLIARVAAVAVIPRVVKALSALGGAKETYWTKPVEPVKETLSAPVQLPEKVLYGRSLPTAHKYRYCGNNPISGADPMGLDSAPPGYDPIAFRKGKYKKNEVKSACFKETMIVTNALIVSAIVITDLTLVAVDTAFYLQVIRRNSGATASGATSATSPVRFGETANQQYHASRHIVEVGASVDDVHGAITQNLANMSNVPQLYRGTVVVDGQTFEYRTFTLPDGTINVGTVFHVP